MKQSRLVYFILTLVLLTVNLWVISKPDAAELFANPLKSVTQISALLGTVFLSIELILISRIKILERIVGPLDRLFQYHKYLSIFSVIALVLHGMTLILNAVPNTALSRVYIIPSFSNLTYATGIIALYLFVTTVAVSLYIKLPYHIWKWTHRILGLSVFFAAYHILTISSDISNSLPLRTWIVGLLFLGIGSLVYKMFLYSTLKRKYRYVVSDIQQKADVMVFYLKPIGKPLPFEAGQFAYFSFKNAQVSTEEHPFSIASRPDADTLVIGIKALGDYTKTLSHIQNDDMVDVRGAHGGFGEDLGKYNREIWIGAGIGVTPFLSLKPQGKTTFYYLTRSQDDAVFSDYLVEYASENPENLAVIEHQSSTAGRFKAAQILSQEQDLSSCCVRVCGPKGLLESIKEVFIEKGIPTKQLMYEHFDYLSS